MPCTHMVAVICTVFGILHGLQAEAGTCLSGSCHQELTMKRFLHGPVAAEQLGGDGCTACHVPAGDPCTPARGGSYKPFAPPHIMCRYCHSRGAGTRHSSRSIDCLECHDPHGSDAGPQLKRRG